MKDKQTGKDEIPPEIDFFKGGRGLQRIPAEAKIFVPATLEREIWEYFSEKAERKAWNSSASKHKKTAGKRIG